MIKSWSLTQEVAGSQNLFYENNCHWIQWKHLGKTQMDLIFELVSYQLQYIQGDKSGWILTDLMETRHPPNVLIIRNQFRIVYRRLYWILLDEFASTQSVLSATYFHVVVALSQAITSISWWSLLEQPTTPQRNHRMRSDNISSNDRSCGCPIIYKDTIHDALLFIDTSTMLDTTKPIF